MSGCFVGRIRHRSDSGHRLQLPAIVDASSGSFTVEPEVNIVEKEVSLSETSEYSAFIPLQPMPRCLRLRAARWRCHNEPIDYGRIKGSGGQEDRYDAQLQPYSIV